MVRVRGYTTLVEHTDGSHLTCGHIHGDRGLAQKCAAAWRLIARDAACTVVYAVQIDRQDLLTARSADAQDRLTPDELAFVRQVVPPTLPPARAPGKLLGPLRTRRSWR